jgi:glycine oxidase
VEPVLHPSSRAGILVTGESAVDPIRLTEALLKALKAVGGELRGNARVEKLLVENEVCRGVILGGGEQIPAEQVVLATGAFTGSIDGVPPEVAHSLRPVKGQILRLRAKQSRPPMLRHVVRTEDVYLVPRPNGELVVGATVEEKGFDTTVTAGGILDLLTAAEEAAPDIRELDLVAAKAGLRPGTPDNAPMIGFTSVDGVVAATGHYRNGILQTPITADVVATLLAKGEEPKEVGPFSPKRFATSQ